ncbi:hypothetical protein [Agromyces larvae]|uniref:Recombinase A n=1 Tax=Agromyces larvae TaxID=2929802 RepID=A0ABY4C0S8_9MICO|nr:hypothetical protein [Agromyces larvae]UOE45098.1 hypothetical protein MTO99_04780 [Agromyces larvae]
MTVPAPSPADSRLDRVGELQSRIRGMEATRLDTRAVPTHPALAEVLPGGSLREGTVVQVDGSTSLVMALLAGPSQSGRWCAVVGLPDFGVEAAARFGISLDRLVLVPDPGGQWLTVAATLAEVIPIVAVRPSGRVSPAEASRLAARIRQRGSVLVAAGDWPGADTVLEVATSEWAGLEPGHGALREREVEVRVGGRGELARGRRARLRLPERGLAATTEPSEPDAPLTPVLPLERRAG